MIHQQQRQPQQTPHHGGVVLPPVVDDSGSGESQSAVVRARYEPDVRGVNRYKHFYNPISSTSGGESIDKKSPRSPRTSPRPRTGKFRETGEGGGPRNKSSGDLPQINDSSHSGSSSPAQKEGFVQQKVRNFGTSNQNIKLQNPIVDTWRVRRRPPPIKGSEGNSQVQNGIIAMETLLDIKQPQPAAEEPIAPQCNSKVVLKSKNGIPSNTSLPDIVMPKRGNHSPHHQTQIGNNVRNKIEGQKSQPDRKPDLLVISQASKIFDSMPSPTTTIIPEVKIITMQSDSGEYSRTSKKASNSVTKSKTHSGGNVNHSTGNNIDNIGNGVRSVSEYVKKIDPKFVAPDSKPKTLYKQYKLSKVAADSETQTEQIRVDLSTKNDVNSKNLEKVNKTNGITDSKHGLPMERRTPKATQTENIALFSNKMNVIYAENTAELEQRTELLEIIDTALSETIDKQSRQLANQFIASSARKQAQVWRDSKEFVSTILVPYSVALANRARSAKLPYEHVASIQLP